MYHINMLFLPIYSQTMVQPIIDLLMITIFQKLKKQHVGLLIADPIKEKKGLLRKD